MVGIAAFALCSVLFGKNRLNDEFFVSNDERIVYTTDIVSDKLMYGAIKSHSVYSVEGEKVKGYSVYYEFKDASSANKAFDDMKDYAKEDISIIDVSKEGKYIIYEYSIENFKDSLASTIRRNVEEMKNLHYSEPLVDVHGEFPDDDPTEPNEEIDEGPEQ